MKMIPELLSLMASLAIGITAQPLTERTMQTLARSGSARDTRWHEDLDVLSKTVSENAKPLQDDAAKKRSFLDAVAQLENDVPRKTDEEIVFEVLKLLAITGDSHTSV